MLACRHLATVPLASDFQAIWHRARNTVGSVDRLTSAVVRECCVARGLSVVSVQEREVGAFARTPAVVLEVDGGRACFPRVPARGHSPWERRRAGAEERASRWENMEWFEPLWVPHGRVEQLLDEAGRCTGNRAIELFDYHTSTIYTVPFQAVCVAQLMPKARTLREFCPLVREAFLAFYGGHRASSIAALIPIVEGVVTRIVAGGSETDLAIGDRIDRAMNAATGLAASLHYDRMWVPSEYTTADYLFGQDERVFIFETFRRWLHRSFFRKTGEYCGATWLNRHLFAHGASSSWQQTANFRRLIVALATLGVIESWYDESSAVTESFPKMDKDGELLWQQALFRAEAQGVLKTLEANRYHKHGRLVPELPTDDGALLRRAMLAEDCISDLVRPLRDAGWSVEVDEPTEDGLYVTVRASTDDDAVGVALLYTCATANETYRTLAERCDVILYRGAPYRQDQFARGVDVHVGPVAAWQPPPPRRAKAR